MTRAAVALVLASALASARAAGAAPLTLDEALALASKESPDLAIARADADGAAADPIASTGAVLPRLDLQASFGHDFTGATPGQSIVIGGASLQLPGSRASNQESDALSFRLSQTLFDWAAFRDIARARASARSAARQYDESVLTLAFEVTRRFYEVVRAERTLDVLERTAVRSDELVSRADALYAAGRAPKADTLQARANLANDRITAEAQRVRVAQARSALGETLGRKDGAEVAVVPPAALEAPIAVRAEPPPVEELLAAARSRRPALAAQAALVDAADAAAGSARGGWLPTISAQGSYSRQGYAFGAPEAVYGDPSRAYAATAQLVLTWNLFEGRRTEATVRRADAQARRARASEDKTAALVAQELASARAALASLGRQVSLASDAVGVAQQGLALARERLEAGLANQLEIRDASLKATQAELSLVQARIDEAIARADLARAAGGPL
ncbi:MAG TPA: TolC family protein [Anaeromyxobacter sp.]|nr:TolC family protein [Anaeromyxobacter sp.]